MDHKRILISRKEFIAQRDIVLVVGRLFESHAQQAARTLRSDRSQNLERQRLDTARDSHRVGGGGKIGCGVGERSVEVEQHAAPSTQVETRRHQ